MLNDEYTFGEIQAIAFVVTTLSAVLSVLSVSPKGRYLAKALTQINTSINPSMLTFLLSTWLSLND